MAIYSFEGRAPELADDAWVAPGAHVMGRVRLLPQSSVWFNAVLRGDNAWITIGARSNIQDGAVLHADLGGEITIGADVTVGHQAMLHGCVIADQCLIGMQAVLLNGARVGRGSIIGAGALVPEGKVIPENSLVLGSPGKVVRTLSEAEVAALLRPAQGYVAKAAHFRTALRRIDEPR